MGRLRGEPEADGVFPEDWIGSVTPATIPVETIRTRASRASPTADFSATRSRPTRSRGSGKHTWPGSARRRAAGQVLDAAERLPVHAHPDRTFAREAFDSPFGKTEAWIVLDTRNGEAEVWVGLREAVEADRYSRWIAEQDVERLLHSLNRISVRPGDVVYVPAGVPHALGAGVLIAELQEPTTARSSASGVAFRSDRRTATSVSAGGLRGALDLSAHEPVLGLPAEARSFFWADWQRRGERAVRDSPRRRRGGRIDGAPRVQVMPSPYGRRRAHSGRRRRPGFRCVGPDLED